MKNEDRKRLPLQDMFSGIPRRYDRLNMMMTLGLDRKWRRRAAAECLSGGPAVMLDLCTGTGDLALLLAGAGEGTVVGLDFSVEMLSFAHSKAARLPGYRPLFAAGDAGAMPFPDGLFGSVGIAFGFRNLVYRNPRSGRHLSELFRVIAPGGRLVIVETSQPSSVILRSVFHLYTRISARLGAVLSRRPGAYGYLSGSMRSFSGPAEVTAMLLDAGFRKVSCRPLLCGAAAIHVAEK